MSIRSGESQRLPSVEEVPTAFVQPADSASGSGRSAGSRRADRVEEVVAIDGPSSPSASARSPEVRAEDTPGSDNVTPVSMGVGDLFQSALDARMAKIREQKADSSPTGDRGMQVIAQEAEVDEDDDEDDELSSLDGPQDNGPESDDADDW